MAVVKGGTPVTLQVGASTIELDGDGKIPQRYLPVVSGEGSFGGVLYSVQKIQRWGVAQNIPTVQPGFQLDYSDPIYFDIKQSSIVNAVLHPGGNIELPPGKYRIMNTVYVGRNSGNGVQFTFYLRAIAGDPVSHVYKKSRRYSGGATNIGYEVEAETFIDLTQSSTFALHIYSATSGEVLGDLVVNSVDGPLYKLIIEKLA